MCIYVGVVVQLSLQASRVGRSLMIVWARFQLYKEWMAVVTLMDQTTNRLLVSGAVVHGLVFENSVARRSAIVAWTSRVD